MSISHCWLGDPREKDISETLGCRTVYGTYKVVEILDESEKRQYSQLLCDGGSQCPLPNIYVWEG